MIRPDALLLDLDGTLIDWEDGLRAGIAAGAGRLAALHGLDAAEVAAAAAAAEGAVYEAHASGWLLGGVGPAELYGALWRHTLDGFGLDPEPADDLAAAHWAAETAAFRAYDDVPLLVESARTAGVPLALVTNGPSAVQRVKLDVVGLADAFDAVLISAEVGVAKPDRGIFDAALDALGLTASASVWHVGDSLEYDVAGAQQAGVTGVWLNRPGWPHGRHQPQPERQITGFAELIPLLAAAA